MIASCDPHIAREMKPLVAASARLYPGFVQELQAESGESADLRDAGAIAFFSVGETPGCPDARPLADAEIAALEPLLSRKGPGSWFLPEYSVDPRGLSRALIQACKHRGVDFVTGSPATEVLSSDGHATGVKTTHSEYAAGVVVNCCGAWAAQLHPLSIPTRPVKGQMVCLVPPGGTPHHGPLIQHVVRTPDVYIIPRSDGRILLEQPSGSGIRQACRSGHDPDSTPVWHRRGSCARRYAHPRRVGGTTSGLARQPAYLGRNIIARYFAATGHYRDGIMLAPITAQIMAELITGSQTAFDLQPFSPVRFAGG